MKMKIVCRSSFSELPSNIIVTILLFLPLKDAARTSVLSKNWRYQWEKIPHLVFDTTFCPAIQQYTANILLKIYEILLSHEGAISKFTLSIANLRGCSSSMMNKIVRFLSMNGIQDLNLFVPFVGGDFHELPSYIFSCLQLRHLSLYSCVCSKPRVSTFKGFSKLVSLELRNVTFTLGVSISNCPLLERLTLDINPPAESAIIDAPNLKYLFFKFSTCEKRHINVKVCGGLPLIEELHMDCRIMRSLVPNMLPMVLNYLRSLELSQIVAISMDDLPCILCLIRNSPNLQELNIELCDVEPMIAVGSVSEYIGMQEHSTISLNKVTRIQMKNFSGLKHELEFIKILLTRSPVLETMYINPASREIIVKNGYKMFMELTRFRRASQKAEIIFHDLYEDHA